MKRRNNLEIVWEKGKVRVLIFSGCFEMVESLPIYMPINGVNMEAIYGLNKWPIWLVNWLGSWNNRFLLPKL